MLKRVILPTQEVMMAHEETYRQLSLAGVSHFAVSQFVLDMMIQSPDDDRVIVIDHPNDMGQALLEYLVDDVRVDLSNFPGDLYQPLCDASMALYAELTKVRDLLMSSEQGCFVSGITQQKWIGADMVVMVETTDMRRSA